MGDQRVHQAAIHAAKEILTGRLAVGRVVSGGMNFLSPLQNADRRPRRDDEGNGQRESHRRARADRNRAHIRPHQSADERHRQHGGDHGEGRQDSWVTDLANSLDRHGNAAAPGIFRQMKMADDVFHHDDRVVHEDADGEDQREERDAVQREAVEIKHQQRQCERRGNRQQHDERLAPAERQQDQERHAHDRKQHVPEQLVGFFLRGASRSCA